MDGSVNGRSGKWEGWISKLEDWEVKGWIGKREDWKVGGMDGKRED